MDSRKVVCRFILFCDLIVLTLFVGCERTVTIPPPDEPPPKGYIFIDTYPTGMQIFMDGKDRRRLTPDSITWLSSKEYEFTLKHPFYLDTVFQILATETQRESLYIDYRRNKKMLSTLELDSYPQGASIYLNDSLLSSKTPLILKNKLPGYYKIKYTFKNHREVEHTILLQSNKVTKSFLALVDLTLWVDYNSNNSRLNSDKLTCITKDQYNNIWIGSEDWGIYRYNGFNFKCYYRGNSPVLCNTINDIDFNFRFTKKETMLIATTEMAILVGPERIFGENDSDEWQFWRAGDSILPLPDYYITSIAVEVNGKFWFGTKKGLISSFPESMGYIHKVYTSTNSPLVSNYISNLAWKNDELWIGTKSSGMMLFQNNIWDIFGTFNSGLRSDNINSILPLESKSCYIGISTNSSFTPGLAYLDNSSWFNEYFNMPDNNVLSLYKDSRGRIWVGTETSIIVFTTWGNRKIYTYETSGLPVKNISGFIEDVNGNILITSNGGGLFRYLD